MTSQNRTAVHAKIHRMHIDVNACRNGGASIIKSGRYEMLLAPRASVVVAAISEEAVQEQCHSFLARKGQEQAEKHEPFVQRS